jgi:protein-L-isoaspartate(D-aspartate) O-methyltransferase
MSDGAPGGEHLAAERDAHTLHLLMRLRARGVTDRRVLRAFEAVPRSHFTAPAHRDLAGTDASLPTGCGQTVGSPSDLALALAALDLRPEHHALDIGTGSGYAAAVMACLAGRVLSVDRFRTLVIEAAERLAGRGIPNARVLRADALADLPEPGPFQRAFIDFAVEAPPEAVARRLEDGAICVFARPGEGMCHLVRARKSGSGWSEDLIGLTRAGPPIAGLSAHL